MGRVVVGVIGGTGLGEALGGLGQGEVREVETPFGRPSGGLTASAVGAASGVVTTGSDPVAQAAARSPTTRTEKRMD